jgi:hypothetical protein
VAAERLSMRPTREILRLKWACHRSHRAIAQSCSVARTRWPTACTAADAVSVLLASSAHRGTFLCMPSVPISESPDRPLAHRTQADMDTSFLPFTSLYQ